MMHAYNDPTPPRPPATVATREVGATSGDGDDSGVVRPPGEVLAMLREQAALYSRLESLAARQRSLVTGDDMGPLLAVLADRRKVAADLEGIVTQLAPVRHRWSAYRARLTPAQRVKADQWLTDASERLRRVMESDRQDARVLSGRKQAVAAALRVSHSTDRAMSAYHTSVDHAGRLDCTDEGDG